MSFRWPNIYKLVQARLFVRAFAGRLLLLLLLLQLCDHVMPQLFSSIVQKTQQPKTWCNFCKLRQFLSLSSFVLSSQISKASFISILAVSLVENLSLGQTLTQTIRCWEDRLWLSTTVVRRKRDHKRANTRGPCDCLKTCYRLLGIYSVEYGML